MDFEIGDEVIVDDPRPNDLWNHSFSGTVKAFRYGCIVVEDQDGDCWDVDHWQLKLEEMV
jgi:hypothetical protein